MKVLLSVVAFVFAAVLGIIFAASLLLDRFGNKRDLTEVTRIRVVKEKKTKVDTEPGQSAGSTVATSTSGNTRVVTIPSAATVQVDVDDNDENEEEDDD